MSTALPFRVPREAPADDTPTFDAPADLVHRYLDLTARRRALEDQLAFVRAELEMLATGHLSDGAPKARLVAPGGAVVARLQPTCQFDRGVVAQELQRMGRLAEVAVLQGPSLARFLAREPGVAARLGAHVRHRKGVVLTGVT